MKTLLIILGIGLCVLCALAVLCVALLRRWAEDGDHELDPLRDAGATTCAPEIVFCRDCGSPRLATRDCWHCANQDAAHAINGKPLDAAHL